MVSAINDFSQNSKSGAIIDTDKFRQDVQTICSSISEITKNANDAKSVLANSMAGVGGLFGEVLQKMEELKRANPTQDVVNQMSAMGVQIDNIIKNFGQLNSLELNVNAGNVSGALDTINAITKAMNDMQEKLKQSGNASAFDDIVTVLEKASQSAGNLTGQFSNVADVTNRVRESYSLS